MTEAKRKAEERKRKREAGLVPVEIWCGKNDVQLVRHYVESLNQCRLSSQRVINKFSTASIETNT